MTTPAKPKVRPISDSRGRKYYRVSYRGHTADVWEETSGYPRWRSVVEGSGALISPRHDGEDALAAAMADIDRLADCNDAQTKADQFMTRGGLTRMAALHADAPEYFRTVLAGAMKGDHDAAQTIADLIKVASKRKAPKAVTGEYPNRWPGPVKFTVIPGLRVEVDMTRMIRRMFMVGNPNARKILDALAEGIWIDDNAPDHASTRGQVDPKVAAGLRTRCIQLGREFIAQDEDRCQDSTDMESVAA